MRTALQVKREKQENRTHLWPHYSRGLGRNEAVHVKGKATASSVDFTEAKPSDACRCDSRI